MLGLTAWAQQPFGWRGDGTGRYLDATPVTRWSESQNVRWSTVVGSSYSSPILSERFVLVTSEPDLLLCLDRADGKVRWKLALTAASLADPAARAIADRYQPPKDGSGFAAATPITDGKNVYALFANGLLCAVDLDGHLQWSACIEAAQSTGYGRSASPIIAAGKLIVHMTDLYAFDPATGQRLWVNSEAKSSYGTPIVAGSAILTSLGDLVRAEDGKTLNSSLGHTSHSSPIAGEGLVIFADSSIAALRLDGAFKEESVWNAMVSGEVFGSPLLHDGTLFVVTGDGELLAFDARGQGTLEPLFEARALFPDAGSPAVYASLALAGRYLFLNSNHGEMVVMEATRQAPIVSRNKLPAGSGSPPVFSNKEMFLRAGDKLWCIGE